MRPPATRDDSSVTANEPSSKEAVKAIVAEFRANSYQPLGTGFGNEEPERIRSLVAALDREISIDDHASAWRPDDWHAYFDRIWSGSKLVEVHRAIDLVAGLTEPDADGLRPVARRHLHQLASAEPVELLVAVMIWGYGPGRGMAWFHTRKVLERNSTPDMDSLGSVNRALNGYRRLARSDDPTVLAWAWCDREPRIAHLRAAYATKYAYACAYSGDQWSKPLIADQWVAWSFWALTHAWDIRTSPELYRRYIEMSNRWAHVLGCRSDEVERAMFELGRPIARAWNERSNGML
jgi:hypothetical protein